MTNVLCIQPHDITILKYIM